MKIFIVCLEILIGLMLQRVTRAQKIRGTPGIDYPTYYEIPVTSFRCSDQKYIPGFYADPETACQVFHSCHNGRQESYLCPTGTIFNQAILACDYWYASKCSSARSLYHVNAVDADEYADKSSEDENSSSNYEGKQVHQTITGGQEHGSDKVSRKYEDEGKLKQGDNFATSQTSNENTIRDLKVIGQSETNDESSKNINKIMSFKSLFENEKVSSNKASKMDVRLFDRYPQFIVSSGPTSYPIMNNSETVFEKLFDLYENKSNFSEKEVDPEFTEEQLRNLILEMKEYEHDLVSSKKGEYSFRPHSEKTVGNFAGMSDGGMDMHIKEHENLHEESSKIRDSEDESTKQLMSEIEWHYDNQVVPDFEYKGKRVSSPKPSVDMFHASNSRETTGHLGKIPDENITRNLELTKKRSDSIKASKFSEGQELFSKRFSEIGKHEKKRRRPLYVDSEQTIHSPEMPLTRKRPTKNSETQQIKENFNEDNLQHNINAINNESKVTSNQSHQFEQLSFSTKDGEDKEMELKSQNIQIVSAKEYALKENSEMVRYPGRITEFREDDSGKSFQNSNIDDGTLNYQKVETDSSHSEGWDYQTSNVRYFKPEEYTEDASLENFEEEESSTNEYDPESSNVHPRNLVIVGSIHATASDEDSDFDARFLYRNDEQKSLVDVPEDINSQYVIQNYRNYINLNEFGEPQRATLNVPFNPETDGSYQNEQDNIISSRNIYAGGEMYYHLLGSDDVNLKDSNDFPPRYNYYAGERKSLVNVPGNIDSQYAVQTYQNYINSNKFGEQQRETFNIPLDPETDESDQNEHGNIMSSRNMYADGKMYHHPLSSEGIADDINVKDSNDYSPGDNFYAGEGESLVKVPENIDSQYVTQTYQNYINSNEFGEPQRDNIPLDPQTDETVQNDDNVMSSGNIYTAADGTMYYYPVGSEGIFDDINLKDSNNFPAGDNFADERESSVNVPENIDSQHTMHNYQKYIESKEFSESQKRILNILLSSGTEELVQTEQGMNSRNIFTSADGTMYYLSDSEDDYNRESLEDTSDNIYAGRESSFNIQENINSQNAIHNYQNIDSDEFVPLQRGTLNVPLDSDDEPVPDEQGNIINSRNIFMSSNGTMYYYYQNPEGISDQMNLQFMNEIKDDNFYTGERSLINASESIDTKFTVGGYQNYINSDKFVTSERETLNTPFNSKADELLKDEQGNIVDSRNIFMGEDGMYYYYIDSEGVSDDANSENISDLLTEDVYNDEKDYRSGSESFNTSNSNFPSDDIETSELSTDSNLNVDEYDGVEDNATEGALIDGIMKMSDSEFSEFLNTVQFPEEKGNIDSDNEKQNLDDVLGTRDSNKENIQAPDYSFEETKDFTASETVVSELENDLKNPDGSFKSKENANKDTEELDENNFTEDEFMNGLMKMSDSEFSDFLNYVQFNEEKDGLNVDEEKEEQSSNVAQSETSGTSKVNTPDSNTETVESAVLNTMDVSSQEKLHEVDGTDSVIKDETDVFTSHGNSDMIVEKSTILDSTGFNPESASSYDAENSNAHDIKGLSSTSSGTSNFESEESKRAGIESIVKSMKSTNQDYQTEKDKKRESSLIKDQNLFQPLLSSSQFPAQMGSSSTGGLTNIDQRSLSQLLETPNDYSAPQIYQGYPGFPNQVKPGIQQSSSFVKKSLPVQAKNLGYKVPKTPQPSLRQTLGQTLWSMKKSKLELLKMYVKAFRHELF